ncbi:HotDog domain-containing protein [Powellomyces hirtus]|nr:HotDog domain-containing protein [Powellomyces hirtus]
MNVLSSASRLRLGALSVGARRGALSTCRAKSTAAGPRVPVGALASIDETRNQIPPALKEVLAGYPSLINLPVQWGEQDAFGHLNNVVYMRYIESGRLAYFDQILKPHLSKAAYNSFIQARGVGPIVKSVSCKYIAPVRYPDTVTVAVKVHPDSVKKDRFTQSAIVVSHAQERIVASSESVIVTFDYREQCKADIPQEVLAAWKKGEGIE